MMPLFRRRVRIRWWIFAFTLAFPMLSYIPRLGVQDLAGTVMPALHLSQLQIGDRDQPQKEERRRRS